MHSIAVFVRLLWKKKRGERERERFGNRLEEGANEFQVKGERKVEEFTSNKNERQSTERERERKKKVEQE